jgi:hypothetical protein
MFWGESAIHDRHRHRQRHRMESKPSTDTLTAVAAIVRRLELGELGALRDRFVDLGEPREVVDAIEREMGKRG